MADPRFFSVSPPIALGRLAEIADAEIASGDPAREYQDVRPLSDAGADHVSFLDNKKYVDQFLVSGAGACVATAEMAARAPDGMALLVTENPYLGYARIAQAFYAETPADPDVSQAAAISPSAVLGENTTIHSGAVIGDKAEIGERCVIGPNVVIGRGCVIGADTTIHANVTLSHCIIGERVTVFPGACIGQDGFGFAISPAGAVKVPQLGRVVIGDDVEIGANTTIDRGAGPDTVIGAGAMIDNLVQIAHNVEIGKYTVIAAQVGISGSTRIGDGVMIGGQAGFAGHMTVGDGARVGAKAGLFRDVDPGTTVGGYPAKPMRQWFKEQALLERWVKKGK